jgi:hypothetical protein
MARLALIVCVIFQLSACTRQSTLPRALSDGEFTALAESLSEPGGSFGISDNFVSNEPHLAENARWLRPAGGAYIGVGPEQNFTYISRAQPEIAFIVDIRRENRNLHLLYKALFELAADRADFLARLFSRAPAASHRPGANVEELFAQVDAAGRSPDGYASNLSLVRERLTKVHQLPLTPEDLRDIERALQAFADAGPEIHFWGTRAVDRDTVRPSYRTLMSVRDLTGQSRSFLSTDAAFGFVKDLQSRNLIVPVIGDFGGAGAIRRVGDYLRSRGSMVQAFYGSNVSVYLTRQQARAYCGYLRTLPAAPDASFIDSDSVRTFASKLKDCEGRR